MFTGGAGLGNFARKGGKGPQGFREKMSGMGWGKGGGIPSGSGGQGRGVRNNVGSRESLS